MTGTNRRRRQAAECRVPVQVETLGAAVAVLVDFGVLSGARGREDAAR